MSARTLAIVFAVATACFWGLYGPALEKARTTKPPAQGGWSPFKPYLFIGVAYLVWGCLGGAIAMKVKQDTFSFAGEHQKAATWGFAAGSLGAFGALTLTMAVMTAGQALRGTGASPPALVMPIVFGGAVTVTALTSVFLLWGRASPPPLLWVGMILVVSGIVLVAKYTPRETPGAQHAPAKASESPASTQTHS